MCAPQRQTQPIVFAGVPINKITASLAAAVRARCQLPILADDARERIALAMALGVPATRIHEIVKERRGITADTAERLARYFGGDAASWLALQADYDLKTLATRNDIARKVSPREGAPA